MLTNSTQQKSISSSAVSVVTEPFLKMLKHVEFAMMISWVQIMEFGMKTTDWVEKSKSDTEVKVIGGCRNKYGVI